MNNVNTLFVVFLSVALLNVVEACAPGRRGFRRRIPRKLTPLIIQQYVPNTSEQADLASGPFLGPVKASGPQYRKLVPNYNKDIHFIDKEGTGAARIMTQRLRDKVNILAVSVMNQWPGVKLRIIEGYVFKPDGKGFRNDSLHLEARAVDITTDDRHRAKYGMLARLAFEAGFDWVYYESKKHIHCSVKSDAGYGARRAGCFERSSIVQTRLGGKPVSRLRIGEEVLTFNEELQKFEYSPVLTFLDRDPEKKEVFVKIKTDAGQRLLLTRYHLIYRQEYDDEPSITYASLILKGDIILVSINETLVRTKVTLVETQRSHGVYAPLTATGNIVVNDVVASCYALVNDHELAHRAFAPLRAFYSSVRWFQSIMEKMRSLLRSPSSESLFQSRELTNNDRLLAKDNEKDPVDSYTASFKGVHWYAQALYYLFHTTLGSYML